jgi:hypothetical protein
MGAVHPHCPAHNSPIYELFPPDPQNTSRPRDGLVHRSRYVEHES